MREIFPDDNFILADTGKRQVALWIDKVPEVKEIVPGTYTDTKASLPYADFINGVAKIKDEFIQIYDLEQCLNLKEEIELEKALSSKKNIKDAWIQ